MKRFAGKTVLVTGSAKGIGRSIAVRLAKEGASVIVNSRHNDENVAETMRLIQAEGVPAFFVEADISRVDAVKDLIQKSIEFAGSLDILINNAGVEIHAPYLEVTEEDYDRVMNTNLKAMFFGTQAFASYLKTKNKPGVIVNISSVHEEVPFPNFAAYCASKGGMQMVMRTIAVELGLSNIRINNVAPGAIKTPMNADLLNDPDKMHALEKNISMGRLGEPEDVAGVVAFLASDDAKYVTGSTYYVDGGLSFHYVEQ